MAPFAGYPTFDACTAANKDKGNPDAYCGAIKAKVEKASQDSTVGKINQFLTALRGLEPKMHVEGVVKELTTLRDGKPKEFVHEEVLGHIGEALMALGQGDVEGGASHLELALSGVESGGSEEDHYAEGRPSTEWMDKCKASVSQNAEVDDADSLCEYVWSHQK